MFVVVAENGIENLIVNNDEQNLTLVNNGNAVRIDLGTPAMAGIIAEALNAKDSKILVFPNLDTNEKNGVPTLTADTTNTHMIVTATERAAKCNIISDGITYSMAFTIKTLKDDDLRVTVNARKNELSVFVDAPYCERSYWKQDSPHKGFDVKFESTKYEHFVYAPDCRNHK